MNTSLLKLIKYAAPLSILAVPLYPFINGLGCSYTFVHDSPLNFQEGRCKAGILSVYIKNKADGTVLLKKMRWGYAGDNLYTYHLDTVDVVQHLHRPKEYDSVTMLYRSMDLEAGKIIRSKDNPQRYITFFEQPIEIVYENRLKGRLGFIDAFRQ